MSSGGNISVPTPKGGYTVNRKILADYLRPLRPFLPLRMESSLSKRSTDLRLAANTFSFSRETRVYPLVARPP